MMVGSTYKFEVSSLPEVDISRNTSKESIFHMVKSKDKKKLQDTINNSNFIEVDYINENDETPLMVACKHKRWVNAFILLDKFGERALPGFINKNGFSVIFYAYTNENLINRLFTYQSVINIITNIFPNGETLLTSLVMNGNFNSSLLLINKTDNKYHNYRNNDGNTALILACLNKQYKIATVLINAGCNPYFYNNEGYNALMYLYEESTKTDELLILYFHIIERTKTNIYIQDFTIYTSEMFTYIINVCGTGGTYGNIKYAYDSNSGRSYILKQYKKANSFNILTDDLVKEIVFIKDLSSKCDSIVTIYGVYVDDNDNFYVVFEPLSVTVHDYIEMTLLFSDTPENNRIRDKKINYIYNTVISTMNKIHINGIVHNDMKFQNMLFNFNGDLKVIDFGIADFIGISPYKNIVQNYMTSSHIKAPDYGENIKINILTEIENSNYNIKTYRFSSCRKSYLSDIFSVGVSFIQAILKRNNKFISIDGVLYKEMKSESLSKENINLLAVGKKSIDLLNSYSFSNELIRMVTLDANSRVNKKPRISNPSEYLKSNNRYISRNVHYSSDEIKRNDYELTYVDQIYLNYKKTAICIDKNSDISGIIDIINRIIKICNHKISIDTYYNTLYYSINYKGSKSTEIVVISYFYIFSYLYQWFPIDVNLFIDEFDIPRNLLIDFVNRFILSVICDIKIIPFISMIKRMMILLQMNGNDKTEIANLEDTILNGILNKFINGGCKFILWDYIQEISYNNITNFPYIPIYQEK